jgi:hypothetical protein
MRRIDDNDNMSTGRHKVVHVCKGQMVNEEDQGYPLELHYGGHLLRVLLDVPGLDLVQQHGHRQNSMSSRDERETQGE